MSSEQSSTGALQEALALHKQGRLDEAGRRYHAVLQSDPNQSNAMHLLGLLAAQQEKPEEAVDWLSQALAINPSSAVCHSDLGLVLGGLERFDQAEIAFRRALELKPRFADALLNLGNLYREFGLLDRAQTIYEQALTQRPGFPEVLENLRALQETRANLAAFVEALRGFPIVEKRGHTSDAGLPKLERRELLPLVLNALGLKGVGAEIGVKEGKFSERILRLWEGGALYSVDPWREFGANDYVDVSNVPQPQQDELYLETIRRLLPFQRRSVIWRLTSKEAAEILPDDSLDFCYIDADHSYRGVSQDIRLWYPKLKKGGVLAGHDYVPDGVYRFGDFGVQRAVNEFVRESNLDVLISSEGECVVNDRGEFGFPSWVVLKK